MKTDDELKQLLAKMLPIYIQQDGNAIVWKNDQEVQDSELLHVCWLIEQTLTANQKSEYVMYLRDSTTCNWDMVTAPWQRRTMALAQVKGLL